MLIVTVLPAYTECIPAMKVLVLGAFFLTIEFPYRDFVIRLKKHMNLIPVFVFSSILAVVLNGVAIAMHWGITGIALASTVVLFTKYTLTFIRAHRYIKDARLALTQYGTILAKFACMLILLILIENGVRTGNDMKDAGLCFLIYLFFQIPLFWELNHRLGLMTYLKSKLFRRGVAA